MFFYQLPVLISFILLILTNGQDYRYRRENEKCFCSCAHHPVDCSEILRCGKTDDGIYQVWPRSKLIPEFASISVYCDMTNDKGGWTVIQRRGDFGRPKDYFFKDWNSYKEGFGNLMADFWLGNDKISAFTNQRIYSLRFDLRVEKDTRYYGGESAERKYALYDQFSIDNEHNNYTMHVTGYTGNAGDSFSEHDGMQFTTLDSDNDIFPENCALLFKGGWWYKKCHHSNLNGLYLNGPHGTYADGIEWSSWKGFNYSLPKAEMKIRPINFNPTVRCHEKSNCSRSD